MVNRTLSTNSQELDKTQEPHLRADPICNLLTTINEKALVGT